MKIVSINSVFYGSTAKIMVDISKFCVLQGCEHYVFSGFSKNKINYEHHRLIGNIWTKSLDMFLSYLTGNDGSFSFFSTKRLLKEIDKIKPDIIHLHNIHNNYLNFKMLFSYIKDNDIPVIITMHDCWLVTGHCPHFIFEGCEKWKSGCFKCPKYRLYPSSLFDNSKKMWKRKKAILSSIENLHLVTPSRWLYEIVGDSFLKNKDRIVINNGINLDIFKPTTSSFRLKYSLAGKFVILGVSYSWNYRKGLDVFIELSKKLDDNFKIVLVGTDDDVDKLLPSNIISIHRTQNQVELASIYSSADIFLNPTREDNFPTVHMESLSCGTPVLTFNTGGCGELINKDTGIVIDDCTVESVCDCITKLYRNYYFDRAKCVEFAKQFDKDKKYEEYFSLYKRILNAKKQEN